MRDGPEEFEQWQEWVERKRLKLSKALVLEERHVLQLNMIHQVVAAQPQPSLDSGKHMWKFPLAVRLLGEPCSLRTEA